VGVSTLVCFHAHPDDECIATGGTIAAAHAAGHRTVLVVATRGERGEVAPGVLSDGEALWERRLVETYAAAEALGIDRVEFLGYVDSGMMGEPTNDGPYTFWTADVDAAAERLAAILREEQPDVLTIYDDHGGYGHPDHIQVHRVGLRAAELAGVSTVLQATMNRDHIRTMMEERLAQMEAELANETDTPGEAPADVPDPAETEEFGSPEAIITHRIDVVGQLEAKRRAMAAHASQIPPDSWFMQLTADEFAAGFGSEWSIETGTTRGEHDPFRTSIWG